MAAFNSKPLIRLVVITLVLVLLLSACNYPGLRQATDPAADLIYTSAAETVEAQMTIAAQPQFTPGTDTPTPTNTLPPGSTPNATFLPTVTSPLTTATSPQPSATPRCDLVKFVEDVTVPDDTEINPGQTFVKTWRLQNAGHCTWNTSYALVYEGDNIFNAPAAVPVTTGVVTPGNSVDVSVTLTAPVNSGTHRQNFKLANASSVRFGLGDGSKPFWAQIKVNVPTGIVLDFISQASNAEWKSGLGEVLDTPLVFGGADNDPNGVAKIKNAVKLENGSTSGKILLTVPKLLPNGLISGKFSPHLVQGGDRIKGQIGMMTNPDESCGVGDVTFKLLYQEGSQTKSLGSWNQTCDGSLQKIDVSLSSLVGKNIQVILSVKAGVIVLDNWAIWNSLRIER